jgi:oligosaccharide translocation protein RFT1
MESLENFMFKSISYNVLLQLSFRLFSFVLNAILFRYVSIELIGVCNFRLALLYSTVIFLSREPFRRALPTFEHVKNKMKQFVNSLWLVVLNGILVSIFFGFLWSNVFESPNDQLVPYYKFAVFLCCLSCVIELCGEIPNCLTQMLLLAKLKVLIEASSLLIFNIVFVILAIYVPSLGALSYSIARLINSILYVLSNNYFLLKNLNKNDKKSDEKNKKKLGLIDLLPQIKQFRLDLDYLTLVKAYYTQSILKQILTEGEKYLITAFSLLSFSESGIYDLVNNLGSMIARFIFLPIEDASYIYFTNTLKRGIKYKEQITDYNKIKLNSVKNYFELFLKILSLIGIVVLVFGQSYSKLLLHLYGGEKLSSNTICVNMLRFHCVYIYFLAVNGLTESFFNATMSESQLKKHNYRLVLFSVVFLLLAFIFAKLFHIYGFLLANCLNMAIRIFYSSIYIRSFFSDYSYQQDEPQPQTIGYNIHQGLIPNFSLNVVLFFSILVTKFTESYSLTFLQLAFHLIIGIVLFFITLFTIFKHEKQIVSYLMSFLKSKLK